MLWAYKMTCKILTKHTPLRLVYGKEAVMRFKFVVSIVRISIAIGMVEVDSI